MRRATIRDAAELINLFGFVLQWPSWYFRPEAPFAGAYANHVFGAGNNAELSQPMPRPQQELKGREHGTEYANKVHGQTPTICTVSW